MDSLLEPKGRDCSPHPEVCFAWENDSYPQRVSCFTNVPLYLRLCGTGGQAHWSLLKRAPKGTSQWVTSRQQKGIVALYFLLKFHWKSFPVYFCFACRCWLFKGITSPGRVWLQVQLRSRVPVLRSACISSGESSSLLLAPTVTGGLSIQGFPNHFAKWLENLGTPSIPVNLKPLLMLPLYHATAHIYKQGLLSWFFINEDFCLFPKFILC